MSTLEKTIDLLQTIPENELETVYTFLQFIKFKESRRNTNTENIEDILNNITGSVPDTGKTLEEYKLERIHERYETTG